MIFFWETRPANLILLASAFRLSLACSYTSFDAIYNPYPDCARACLACRDPDYINDFANNCNYAKGGCCLSQFHTTISETWVCVRVNCGEKPAQDAFDVYTKHCSDLGFPLAQSDVPPGYHVSDADAGKHFHSHAVNSRGTSGD